MTSSADDIARLRLMIGDGTTGKYTDAQLTAYIIRYPLMDVHETEPDETDWIPTYDLHGAARDIWHEKAAAITSGSFDFSADGASYSRSQRWEQFTKQASYHEARMAVMTYLPQKWPREETRIEPHPFNEEDEED